MDQPVIPRTPHARGLTVTGAVVAAAIGLGCGLALRPSPVESSTPPSPQQILLAHADLATGLPQPR